MSKTRTHEPADEFNPISDEVALAAVAKPDDEGEDEGEGGGEDESTGAKPEGDSTGDAKDPEEDELIITFDGEEASAPDANEPSQEELAAAPAWVRNTRKEFKGLKRKLSESDRQIRELEQRLQASRPSEAEVLDPGPRPALDDDGIEFDTNKFNEAIDAWHIKRAQAEANKAKRQQAEDQARQQWQEKLDAYGKAKTALKVPDFEVAEDSIKSLFSITQQGVILAGAEDPAKLVYALGKNGQTAARLAKITDPVKFAWEVAKLEAKMKVTPTKQVPPPERVLRSGAAGPRMASHNLEAELAKARKTGDYSQYYAAKRMQEGK